MPLQVDVVSPERVVYSGVAKMVTCRTTEGEIAFLPGHVPFIGLLAPGEVYVSGDEEYKARIASGFVEVSNDRVVILSDDLNPTGAAG